MPNITLPTRDAWPEELREHVKEESGGFVLNVVPKAKLDEFRETNINVARERDELKTQVESLSGILPEDMEADAFQEHLAELRAIAQRVKDGELTESADIEAEVAKRTTKMRSDMEAANRAAAAKTAAAEKAAAEATAQYRNLRLEQAVSKAVMNEATGANPAALDYIISDAARVFKFDEEGNMVPKQGEATLYGADGASPMTMEEWVTELVSTKPLLAKSSGGGGDPDPSKKFFGYSKEDYNKLSPMQKLELANSQKK